MIHASYFTAFYSTQNRTSKKNSQLALFYLCVKEGIEMHLLFATREKKVSECVLGRCCEKFENSIGLIIQSETIRKKTEREREIKN